MLIKEKSLTHRTFGGLLWMASGSGLQALLQIGVLVVLARILAPEEFGLVGTALVVVGFSKVFRELGVASALIQRKKLEDRHLTTAFTFSLLMGGSFFILLIFLAEGIAGFFRMSELTPILQVIGLVFVFEGFSLVPQALLQRNLQFKRIALISIASYAVGYGAIGILFASLGWGVWALAGACLAQTMMKTFLIVIVQRFPKKIGFNVPAFRELMYFGSGMTIARVGNYLAGQGDNLVVARTLGAAALGLYGRAYGIMVMPVSLFGSVLDRVLFPTMAKVQDNKAKLGEAYLTAVTAIGVFALPVGITVAVFANEIVLTLLGENWMGVVIPLQILSCGLLFRMSYKMSDSLSRATGAVYRRAWRQLVFAGLVLCGSWIGSIWGLTGVAVGVVTALAVNFTLMAHLSIALTNVRWRDFLQAHVNAFCLGVLTVALAFPTQYLFREVFPIAGPLLRLLACLFTLGSLGGVIILLFPALFLNQRLVQISSEMSIFLFRTNLFTRFVKPKYVS